MESNPIILFELDVAVPAQQFRIEYTLVDKGGLPVVPEFLLRLLKISALLPSEIARYFGFTIKELSVAITPFLQSGEIRIRPDGRVELTELGLRMFSEAHETPMVKRKVERQQTFAFDLVAFTYLGRSLTSTESRRALELHAPAETLTESCRMAVSAFMTQIYDIHRAGALGGNQQESLPPELYKVADAQKTREGWEIIEERAGIDPDSRQIRFTAKEGLRENESYLRQRTEQLSRHVSTENLEQVLALADYLGDSDSYDFLKSSGLDLQTLHSAARSVNTVRDSTGPRLFGSLQLQGNWERVSSVLRKHQKDLQRTHQEEPTPFTWLAPAAHGLWGKSSRHGQICSAFSEFASAKSQKGKTDSRSVFDVKLLIPLSGEYDTPGMKRAKSDCSDAKELLCGFVESERIAPLEAIIIRDRCAVVIYHLVIPKVAQVPIPFGFITEDPVKVKRIESLVSSSLDEYVLGNVPRFLGSFDRSGGRGQGGHRRGS
ncbi:hypothetical protein FQZ97_705850 [compost metagenome]